MSLNPLLANPRLSILLILCATLLVPSCSKDSPEPGPSQGNPPAQDGQLLIATGSSPQDSLVAVLRSDQNAATINFYGLKDIDGTVTSIYSASVKRDENDTTHVFIVNSNNELSSYYREVSGVRDSSVLKFSYQDSLTIVSCYHMDWISNIITLRGQLVFQTSIDSLLNVVRSGRSNLRDLVGVILGDIIVAEGIVYAIAATTVASVATGVAVAVLGTFVIMHSLNNLISSASATEFDEIPGQYFNASTNPQTSIDFINSNPANEQWGWCAFAVYHLRPHTGWMDWNSEQSDLGDITTGQDIMGAWQMCDTGASIAGQVGFMISVRPGGWITLHQGESGGCPSIPVGTWRTIGTFSCPE